MKQAVFPQEVEVWYLIPAIRKEIAIELGKLGINQKKIAETLGITGAAVSQYVSKKRGNTDILEGLNAEIKSAAKRLFQEKTSSFQEIMIISKLAKDKGILCKLHKEYGNVNDCCEKTCKSTYEVHHGH